MNLLLTIQNQALRRLSSLSILMQNHSGGDSVAFSIVSTHQLSQILSLQKLWFMSCGERAPHNLKLNSRCCPSYAKSFWWWQHSARYNFPSPFYILGENVGVHAWFPGCRGMTFIKMPSLDFMTIDSSFSTLWFGSSSSVYLKTEQHNHTAQGFPPNKTPLLLFIWLQVCTKP